MLKKIIFFFSFILICNSFNKIFAQKDTTQTVDLFADLELESKKSDANSLNKITSAFKSTRVINSHTVEMVGKHNLDFRISHRFGFLSSGGYELFGLDNATMRLGLDYGIGNNLNIGIGRSTVDKELDAFIKYKILQQSTGKTNTPISMAYVLSVMHYGLRTTPELSFSNRLSFAHQLLVARKFSDNFSMQLMPTMVHINAVPLAIDDNNLYSLGIASRVKISKRVAINGEYFYQFNQLSGTTNSLSLGFDIETGGHVFQLQCSNSTGMNERGFITNTNGKWGNGDIRFGFNIVRTFALKKSSTAKTW